MKLVVVTLVLAFTAVQGFPFLGEFMEWKQKHGKTYPSAREELRRMLVYLDNWAYVHKYNSQSNRKMTLGMNEYADLTHEEFKAQMLGTRMESIEWDKLLSEMSEHYQAPLGYTAPSTVDWRQKGAVTSVKNQGACGSCYSFSTTGSIEGQWFLSKGHLVTLSEQQIMDCSGAYGNTPCQGGLMSNSFRYIINAGGLETEYNYPYQGEGGYCQFEKSLVAASIRSYQRVSPSESSLKMASAIKGPISVGIDASHRSFQLYSGGVYDEPECSDQIDHAVLVVGYGTDSQSGDYWLVKNSWGTSWGEDGYVRMSRNNGNMCGIANMASFPVV